MVNATNTPAPRIFLGIAPPPTDKAMRKLEEEEVAREVIRAVTAWEYSQPYNPSDDK